MVGNDLIRTLDFLIAYIYHPLGALKSFFWQNNVKFYNAVIEIHPIGHFCFYH